MASPTDCSVTPVSPNPASMSDESKGSSVSTVLREEYEDLLRYAVVTPMVDSKVVKHTQSPEKSSNLASPRREESVIENAVGTSQRHSTPHKTEGILVSLLLCLGLVSLMPAISVISLMAFV